MPDTSEELLVYRYKQGVKLISPEKARNILPHNYMGHTVGSLLNLPICAYFDDPEIIVQNMNELNAEAGGFESVQNSLGKTLFDVFTAKTAQIIVDNDKEVIRSQKIQIVEEEAYRKDDLFYQALSIKFPWYNSENKVVGLFGFSIMLGKQPLAESLALITKLGLLNYKSDHILPGSTFCDSYLSKRESQCLHYYVQGKTAKEIGKALQLSPRTVENYIQNIKTKLNIWTKAELIHFYNQRTN